MLKYAWFANAPLAKATSALAGVPPWDAMNRGFQLEACVVSSVPSYDPLVTPRGKPGNAGTGVATPVLSGGLAQQWMCAIVVGLVRPLKVTLTRSRCAVVSSSTEPSPAPGEITAGFSFAPLRVKLKCSVAALPTEAIVSIAATRLSANALRLMSSPPVLRLDLHSRRCPM